MNLRPALLLSLLTSIACTSTPSSPSTQVSLGQEFVLKAGETAQIESTDLRVTFLGVASDSRCPGDAICVQAGEAVVALRVGTAEVQLRSASAPEQVVGIYRVRLSRVEPYPFVSQPIAPGDYRAALVVTRR